MMPDNLGLFAVACLALLAAPGPTNALLTASGTLAGILRSIPLIAAELLAYAISIGLLVTLAAPSPASTRPCRSHSN